MTTRLLLPLLLLAPAYAAAAVPGTLTYSGRLTDGTATEQSKSLDLRVTVYACEEASGCPEGDPAKDGAVFWQEFEQVPVVDGYFKVEISSHKVYDKDLDWVDGNVQKAVRDLDAAWMGLEVKQSDGSWEKVRPRVKLGSVPFAVHAATADGVDEDGGDSVLTAMKRALGHEGLSDAAFKDYMNGLCPLGYEQDAAADEREHVVVCTKDGGEDRRDEMVKVGDFWVDRYETTIWENPDCTGTCYGCGEGNWATTGAGGTNADSADVGFFPRNGNWTTPLHACSVVDTVPSRWVTWFQAAEACALSGKHLCTNAEWQVAASGTDISECNTGSSGEQGYDGAHPERTGSLAGPRGTGCRSRWGTFDQAGNVWEWVSFWGQAGSDQPVLPADDWYKAQPWPEGYGSDGTWHIVGDADRGNGDWAPGAPAAFARGGDWQNGTMAGQYCVSLSSAPTRIRSNYGFRCCRR